MKVLSNYGDGVDTRVVQQAVEALRQGQIIIYPTDTLYALGCNGLDGKAIERLCRIKGINPDKNLLSIVCSDLSEVSKYARVDNNAFRLLKQYLPGPYTFVLPAAPRLPKVFKGRRSVGVRIPDNAFARALSAEFGAPVLTSSVNVTADGNNVDADITDARSLAMHYGYSPDIVLAVDCGAGGDMGSTVVDCTDSSDPVVIRQGTGVFTED